MERIRRIDQELSTGAPKIETIDVPQVRRVPPTPGLGIEL
jgi:hypothetical protein